MPTWINFNVNISSVLLLHTFDFNTYKGDNFYTVHINMFRASDYYLYCMM